jgi:hypothetical protein
VKPVAEPYAVSVASLLLIPTASKINVAALSFMVIYLYSCSSNNVVTVSCKHNISYEKNYQADYDLWSIFLIL